MTTTLPFRHRFGAGRRLVAALQKHAGRNDVRVLALPSGGPRVARALAVRDLLACGPIT